MRVGTLSLPTGCPSSPELAGTALQIVEMAVHTAAVVDHPHLVAGHATPVLTTHLVMSVLFYPLFGAATIYFIVAAARARAVGSHWIGWLGIAGAAAHGLSAPLVVGLEVAGARFLFPMVLLLSAWLVAAALWPRAAAVAPPLGAGSRA